MFEKRQDDISCLAVAGAGGIGPAAGPAAVTPSAPSQSPDASSAVCTSRHRTTQDSRVSTTASRHDAPLAMRPASARASAPVATGDLSSPPSPTSTCRARPGPAPPRPLGPGVDTRFRRRLVRAAFHRMHARRHAPGGAGHGGTRHHAGGALCRSPGPDSVVGTAAKCVWTGRAWRLSSASSVRRTGTAMACIDTATHRHRREGCTPNRLNGDRGGSVLGATLIKRTRPLSTAFEATSWSRPRSPSSTSTSERPGAQTSSTV